MAEKSLTFNIFGKDVSGSKAVGDFQKKASGHVNTLVRDLAGLALGYFGLTSAITFGKASVDAAMAAETANTKLGVALENTKSKLNVNSEAIKKAKDKLSEYGFTGAQVADALAIMTTGFGSSSKALDHMQVVADLAKFKNLDLSQSALLVTRLLEGQTRPLKALGIDLPIYAGNAQQVALANAKVATEQQKVNDILAKYPDAAKAGAKGHAAYEAAVRAEASAQAVANDKAAAGTRAVDVLSQRLTGEAAKSAETYAGKWAAVGAKWDEIQVKAGTVLIPALSGVADYLDKKLIPALDETGRHMDAIFKKGQTDAQQLKAVGDGLAQLWQPWGHGLVQIGDWFVGTLVPEFEHGWSQIVEGFGRGWSQIVQGFSHGWSQIEQGFSHGWAQIQQGYAHGWSQIAGVTSHGWSQMMQGFAHGWSQIVQGFTHGWAQIQGFVSGHPLQASGSVTWSNVTPPSPSAGGGGGSYHVTKFASGGIVPARPGGADFFGGMGGMRFAEAGVPEGIIPFTKENLEKLGIGGGGGGQTLNVTVHVTGIVTGNEVSMGQAIVAAITKAQKMGYISSRDWGFAR